MNCEELKLEDIILLEDKKRKPLSTMERVNKKGIYPYYGAQEIIDYVNDYIFDGKYILLAEDGENLKSRKKSLVKIVEGKFWLNNHAHIFKTKNNVDLNYLYYYLLKLDLSEYITGSTQPKLNQENMCKIKIKLPKLDIQHKISHILSNIDEKIKLNNQINDNLYEIALSLLDEDFKNSTVFNKLSESIKFIKGKKPKNIETKKIDGYEKYLTIACLNNQEMNYADIEKIIMCDNDILMVMDGASSGESYYYNHYGIVGSTLSKIEVVTDKLNNKYVYFVLKKYEDLIKSKNTGSAIPHTDKVFVGSLEIPIIDEKKQFLYSVILDKISKLQDENKVLEQLRDTLLPNLMNGEIELENLEI